MNKENRFYMYFYIDKNSNVPFYVGKGCGDRCNRIKAHAKDTTMTANKIKSIGIDNVKIFILKTNISDKEAIFWEKYWINYLGRRDIKTGQLTNHTMGGDGTSGYKVPEKFLKKWSEIRKGKKASPEARRKMSIAHKNKIHKPHSLETREKMSQSRMGMKLSDATRKKMSEYHKNRERSPEEIERIRQIGKAQKGRIVSIETRAKLSLSAKKRRRINGKLAPKED
jgi:hypothetical protein